MAARSRYYQGSIAPDSGKVWTQQDDENLYRDWESKPAGESKVGFTRRVCKLYGRSPQAVEARMRLLSEKGAIEGW